MFCHQDSNRNRKNCVCYEKGLVVTSTSLTLQGIDKNKGCDLACLGYAIMSLHMFICLFVNI